MAGRVLDYQGPVVWPVVVFLMGLVMVASALVVLAAFTGMRHRQEPMDPVDRRLLGAALVTLPFGVTFLWLAFEAI